jgi:hypothetical protein
VCVCVCVCVWCVGGRQEADTAAEQEAAAESTTVEDSSHEAALFGVFVEVASAAQYARRVGDVAAYMDANREVRPCPSSASPRMHL